jgi:hypothetical protein
MAIIADTQREAFVSWASAAGGELPNGYQPPDVPARPESDARFTMGLVIEVAELLERHGYDKLDDLRLDRLGYVDLQQALFRFLYSGAA